MKHLVNGFFLIIKRRDGRWIVFVASTLLITLLFAFQNGSTAIQIFSLDALTVARRISLFLQLFFDMTSAFTPAALVLAILGSILGAFNLALAYVYIKLRGEVILKSGLYSGFGLVLAFLGVGCAACGTAFLATIFSFLGLSSVLEIFPYHGQEIGYVGIIVLFLATYTLAKKVAQPLVC